MNIGIAEAIGLALRAIGANRLRAFLTLIGISIGISAVIALLSIGTGVQDYINNQFTSAGTNLLGIVPGRIQRGPGGGPGSFGSSAFLTLGDYRAVVANVSNIEAHAADFTSTGNFAYESRTSQVQVSGVTPSFSQVRNWRPSIGRFIEEADNTSRSRVVVLGQTVRKDLFPEEDPIGKQVKINGLPFRVIGVMEEKGALIPRRPGRNCLHPAEHSSGALVPAVGAGADRRPHRLHDISAGDQRRHPPAGGGRCQGDPARTAPPGPRRRG